ncbi:hypothetical protein DPMN_144332 [Dreissena polymorpha]|uniref:B box-type domain-containing protein n=1 Tax=Dreissena polymorpha TaxID=45954 RepID=A0A9D4GHX7_DREPO|nr:hypothetical protein DPMN_144332 [Dreissena polymorpha]
MAECGYIEAGVVVSSNITGDCIVIRSCEPCMRKKSANTASVICKVCNEHLCGPCSYLNEIYKPGQHELVVIEHVDSASVGVNMKGMKCDNVDELANISSHEGRALKHLNEKLLILDNESGCIIEKCKLSEDLLSETIANIAKQVDKMRDRIIELFDKAKTKMIEEADDFKAEEMKRLCGINKSSSNVKEDINELLSISSTFVELGTPQQKYIIAKIIKEKMKEEDGIVKLQIERHLIHTVGQIDVSKRKPTKKLP